MAEGGFSFVKLQEEVGLGGSLRGAENDEEEEERGSMLRHAPNAGRLRDHGVWYTTCDEKPGFF
jgi:hypothetical protein